MIYEHKANGYEEFDRMVKGLELSGLPIFILFSGGKDEQGISWCPYCVTGECGNIYIYINGQMCAVRVDAIDLMRFRSLILADPVVHAGLDLIEDDVHFVHVNVGEHSTYVSRFILNRC